MAFDMVIRNGTVVDGTGAPGFEADVAIEGDRIAAIGKNLGPGTREIDARGQVVAPGFIDAHTHMDLFLVLYPHGNPVVNFGVTTVVIGDCGASVAPVPDGAEPTKVLVNYLRRVLDDYIDESSWQWKTFPDYLNYLRGKVGINVAALVPHSPVRLSVMGEAAYQREARPDELEAMKRMVREGMQAGAVGFSTSPRGGPEIHAGTPSTLATPDEIVELAAAAGEFGGCFQFNGFGNLIRPETLAPGLVERVNTLMIGNEFRLRPGAPDEGRRSLAFMEEANQRGKELTGVVIPYQHVRRFDIEDAFIFDGLPTWEAAKQAGDGKRAQLADPGVRQRIESERIAGAGKPAFPDWHGWESVVFDHVDSASLSTLEGKTVADVAQMTGKSPVDAFFDAWLQDDLRSGFYYRGIANGDLEVLAEMIKSPNGLIGTDCGAHLDRFFWHGAPARVIGHWYREKHLFPTLEEAVWKLTGYPAGKLGLNRGTLKVGLPADVTVFDPDRFQDLAMTRLPRKVDAQEVQQHPPGIHAVVVNGQTVVEEGECLDAYPGIVGGAKL